MSCPICCGGIIGSCFVCGPKPEPHMGLPIPTELRANQLVMAKPHPSQVIPLESGPERRDCPTCQGDGWVYSDEAKPDELAEALRLERERVWRLFAILFQGRGDVWLGSEFSRALWEGDAEPRKVEPEADELTVDEVLEVLAHVLRDVTRDVWLSSDVAFGNWHLGRDRFRIRGKGGPLEGTIREVLTEAKKRGLLG